MSKKYTLEVNGMQLAVLRQACEILSRLHMSQMDMVIEEVLYSREYYDRFKERYGEDYHEKQQEIKEVAEYLKQRLTPELHSNAYYGISSREISKVATISYDLNQVMRHCQSWTEHPPKDRKGFLGVTYDTPMKFGTEPLAKITVVDVEEEKKKNDKK